jgi:hypothetical protein
MAKPTSRPLKERRASNKTITKTLKKRKVNNKTNNKTMQRGGGLATRPTPRLQRRGRPTS